MEFITRLLDQHPNAIVGAMLVVVIAMYFRNNPLKHSSWFMLRRFINWFPLGMTYSFLYMGRYNLNVSKNALGTLMTNQQFGTIFAIGLVLSGISVPLLFAHRERQESRHFRVVRDGVLYRSAQLPTSGIGRAVKEVGIRTVVSLRDADRVADQAEEKYCAEKGIRFVRIEPLSWAGVQGTAPIDKGLARFLEVMSDPKNHPVLVHCYRGVHRTGAYVAVYRMECEGWSRDRALTEMVTAGYDLLDKHDDLRGYMNHYRAGTYYRLSENVGVQSNRLFETVSSRPSG